MFQKVWNKYKTKKALLEEIRNIFACFRLDSAQILYDALVYGTKFQRPVIEYDTSYPTDSRRALRQNAPPPYGPGPPSGLDQALVRLAPGDIDNSKIE